MPPGGVVDPARFAPLPGDVGFATIAGGLGGVINVGQALLADACRYTHTFWVVHPLGHPDHPAGLIVEAMPGGARFAPLKPRLSWGHAFATVALSDVQRRAVPRVAARFVSARGGKGIGYSFLSYPALALAQWHVPIPHLKAYIGMRAADGYPEEMICSQLIDEGLRQIGFHLFRDGRWNQDCTPGDCFYALDPRVIPPAPD